LSLNWQEPTALQNDLLNYKQLPQPPEKIFVGNPEDLLGRRPDIVRLNAHWLRTAVSALKPLTYSARYFQGNVGLHQAITV
jgi:hypothetical protein